MSDFRVVITVTTCHHLFPLYRMRDTKNGGTSIPIGKDKKVVAQVVTVVTPLILLRFSCHHFIREVMTIPQMVTEKGTLEQFVLRDPR